MNQPASIQQLAHALISQSSPNVAATLELAQHCLRKGEVALAASLYSHASARHKKNAVLKSELAACYIALGRIEDAIPLAKKACKLKPDGPRAHFLLAEAYRKTNKTEKAITNYQRALSLAPQEQQAARLGLALCYKLLSQEAQAEEQLLQILGVEPSHLAALHNLANLYKTQNRHEEARSCYARVLELEPDNVNTLSHLGETNEELALYDEAQEIYQRVITLSRMGNTSDQSTQRAVFNQARIDLGQHKFNQGWDAYAIREMLPGHPDNPFSNRLNCARWEGQSLEGKHICLLAEQGLGDEISFASLIPDLYKQARVCTIECAQELTALYRQSFPEANIVTRGALPESSLTNADYYQYIPNIARLTRTSRDHFPAEPYLKADGKEIGDWQRKLAELPAQISVGISWKGGTALTKGTQRSIPLEQLLPIFEGIDCELVSLQYGSIEADLQCATECGYEIHQWIDSSTSLHAVGALCRALDLVISIDTTVAHLSSALGQSTWLMLPLNADWRWSLEGEQTPWYPSARLFRKESLMDWAPVCARIRQALLQFAKIKGRCNQA